MQDGSRPLGDTPTVTRTVPRLEQAGFVRRIPAPTDKRSMLVEPAKAGMPAPWSGTEQGCRDRPQALGGGRIERPFLDSVRVPREVGVVRHGVGLL
ncbi:hypothetical protein B1H18_28125 [Streptomyces tsukubensis]|uniref:HTH marR-type domain-containing protein n=1 Tax=Streptomyces tsukubensis TaxID=83656 RepID=A0A1V4A2T7_9ACTN|nr:hypothetical protein B1H18_28125 [Streptomyces tsukubensis]